MKKATKEETELVKALKNQDLGVLVRFLVETREHMKRQTVAMERIAMALERPRKPRRYRDLSPADLAEREAT